MIETGTSDDLAALAAAGRAECAAIAAKLALAARISGGSFDEFVACEVGAALSITSFAAKNLMYLGDVLATRLPGVRRALEAGRLDLGKVRVIIDRTEAITDLVVLAEVERRILAEVLVPGRCATRGQVARAADRVIVSVDPAALIERRRKAETDRCLDVRTSTDGMSSVWGVLPATDGVILDARLREMALTVCGADPRTLDQRRADALIAWANGLSELACKCGSPTCPGAAPTAATKPVVQVVVDAATLLGCTDLPGVLARFGIVDPALVRTLARDARWQRMLTLDGVPAHLGAKVSPGRRRGPTPEALRYEPSERLAALVRTRDGHCRFPGCTVPAATTDLDHVIPFDHACPERGGRTVAENLAALCRWHHRAKTDQVWAVTMNPDGTQCWAGPHGQRLHTAPAGMPPARDATSPPGTAAPVLPPGHGAGPALVAPPAEPPDDHPPPRWTPDGHWADDPWTEHDHEHGLDDLIREIREHTPRTLAAAPAVAATPAVAASMGAVDSPQEPVPF